ncbi:MAG: metallophosphoesterase [Pseudomonadota bacterium]
MTKIAVLSDIHGNLPALEAVLEDIEQWRPDRLIVNGDLVSRGPCSLVCLRLLQERKSQSFFIKGNHETFVISCAEGACEPEGPSADLNRFAQWTAAQIGKSVVDEIRAWSDHLDLVSVGEGSIHVTHGSRLGNRDGIFPRTSDEDLSAKLGDPRDLFIASHTHQPLIRRFNGTQVVNVGSVGQPLDGDSRSAYGRFVFRHGQWCAEIVRLKYDKDRAERDFIDSGFLHEAGPLAQLIYLEVRQSRGHVGRWMRRYFQAVMVSEISVKTAVEEYLAAL